MAQRPSVIQVLEERALTYCCSKSIAHDTICSKQAIVIRIGLWFVLCKIENDALSHVGKDFCDLFRLDRQSYRGLWTCI